ncbi:MAG: ATP-binding cassette domain-containing protein [Marinilabiliaceae bacterium]|nr:ATP-binding cassette domain-containing protein [Marinilabiliaceae bacterium]
MTETNKKRITLTGLREALPLYSFIRPYRLQYGLGLFFLLGSSLANLAFPKLLGELVNAGNAGNLAENINRIALFLGALLVIQSTFSYFRTVLFVTVTEKTLADLRQYTYNHLIKLPLRFFEQRRVGELNSRISSDISLLQETLTSTLAEFIRQVIIIVGGIGLLLYTSFKLTLFMLAILPAVVVLAVVFGRFIRRFSQKAQAEVAESNTIVEETLQGIQSVKSYTNEFLEIGRYKHKTEAIAQVGMKSGRYRGAFAAFLIFGLFGALVTVIWRGSILLAEGEMAAGDLFSFVLYSGFIGGTIGGMASVFTRIQKFLGATEDLFAIFEEEEEQLHDLSENTSIHPLKGAIRFDKVSFAYPNRPDVDVLNTIDLTIQPNQMVALVGASGAGKSTITALLLRLHDVQKGTILFDEIPNREIPLSELRSQIALVPQDIFLFGGSIRENIAYGNPKATEEKIKQAAQNANAMEFIEPFAEGMDTIVGERGTQLSGGQRQRIAIARALLKNPKILILDEATSALDSKSEQLVQDALKRLMYNRTTIVIAHRLSTIKKADMIFVLENGQLVESGTHEQLMLDKKGVYQKLSQLQKMDNE